LSRSNCKNLNLLGSHTKTDIEQRSIIRVGFLLWIRRYILDAYFHHGGIVAMPKILLTNLHRFIL
jgi:hypothetical protein